ncbi:hypothetical protein CRP01_02155 [Flavilitoribacter nigricans DSM 23189 = NBRC 102662]|uniref:Uncharacterized protein n=2 Tax=Flavilitoribacter TaxID=2762562 RepID=A0A2D0NIE8_FLAN2|nr:hypothetical protein CRP01_02155 [Flavilitoribacter nigricans DSM 23189 = NBRC 102662]
MITLLIILSSCKKEISPPAQTNWYGYIGNWENVNAFAGSIDRITITQRAIDQLSVQLWSSCGTEACETGLFSYSQSDLREAVLPMKVLVDNQELSVGLRVSASGKLELKAIEDKAGAFEPQFFSWAQTASFYQQVGPADARSMLLTTNRINGSPRDPDNLLTSGSILIFQTNQGRLGKIQVHGNDFYLSLRWQIWAEDGTIYRSFDRFPFYKIGYYDLDEGQLDESADHLYSDFFWSLDNNQSIRWLEPLNGAAFAVYHLK